MKRYHVKTRRDYQDLMKHLEEEGKLWPSGHKPSDFDCWSRFEENTVIVVCEDGAVWCSRFNSYTDEDIIEYVASIENDVDVDRTQPSYYHQGNIDVIKFGEENFTREEMIAYYRMRAIEALTRYCDKDLDITTFCLDKLREIEKVEELDG